MEDGIQNPENPATPGRVQTIKKWLGIFSLSRIIRWGVLLVTGYWLYVNWHDDIPVHQLIQRYSFPDSRFMELNGMQVHYRDTGRGEPLVLLHDANSSLHTWAGWTDSLARHYRVISVDLPGFGLTGPHPQGSYSAFMYASFFDQFIRQLNLPDFHLAGNGLGAQIAWFYAAEHPGNLRKLILLDARGFEEKNTPWIQWLARTPVLNRILWKITPRDFISLMLEGMYADDQKVTNALVQRHFEMLLRPGNRKAFTDRAQVSENRPPADLIESIRTPTLILWGAEDTRISPEYAYEFHRKIRRADLKIYQNTGHWPQEENAAQSAKDVRAFLEGRF
ncbi:MAG: alpha/beta hydrolase [Thermoanaerobaculia bacterium]|nr:alpha/beta hydrolase [Thermoanaerobaculia bacterium]